MMSKRNKNEQLKSKQVESNDQNSILTKNGEVVAKDLDFSIMDQVFTNIGDETVQNKIVEDETTREVARRADLLKKAVFEERPKIIEKIQEVKPDIEPHFNNDGSSAGGPFYSKKAADNKKQLLNQFEKLKNAIEEAWNKGNFELLDKYFGNK